MRLLALLLSILIAACASRGSGSSTAIPPQGPSSVTAIPPQARASAFTMHVDTEFTPEERLDIEASAKAWREFTSGRVQIAVAFDLDFNSVETLQKYRDAPVILRAQSWMSIVQGESKAVLAWTNQKRQIVMIVDRISSFRAVVTHEMGHAAGLAWPDWCPADRSGRADCHHSPDLNSIMSAQYRGVQTFTDADRAFCRASGYCP